MEEEHLILSLQTMVAIDQVFSLHQPLIIHLLELDLEVVTLVVAIVEEVVVSQVVVHLVVEVQVLQLVEVVVEVPQEEVIIKHYFPFE